MATEAQILSSLSTVYAHLLFYRGSEAEIQNTQYDTNLRKITYEFIKELCKTKPILSAVGGLQMNLKFCKQMAYENKRNWTLSQNKPNSKPIQTQSNPILSAVGGLQMSVNSILTKDYERNDIFAVPENKANSNPIKACPERSRMGQFQTKSLSE